MSLDRIVLEAALRARAHGGAASDILRRAGERFQEEEPSSEDADTWLAEERRTSPHLFISSSGAGAAGSGSRHSPAPSSLDGRSVVPFAELEKLTEE